MDGFPKLSPKERSAKLVRARTFWITEEMDHHINELQRLRGDRVVIEWLRDCWRQALSEAIADAKDPVKLDLDYDT